uniref:hypothetical protein n=1 Tax=Ekhidna sp. TaxID=2608089 RepID=UPI003510DFA1
MLKSTAISVFLLLLVGQSLATEIPTCGGGTADANAEDGIEIADGVCAVLYEDIATVDGILIQPGATLTIYGDITSLTDKIDINTGGTLILYGNIDGITNGIKIDGGVLEIYSNVIVSDGFDIKASSKLVVNGGNLTVVNGDGKLSEPSSELEMFNASTIEIVDGASKIDNSSNGTITSDNTGNTIETDTWDGGQGDFTCSSGTCSDFASSAHVTITESGGRTLTSESGANDSFTVELSGGLTLGTVTVSFVSSDPGEGTVSPSSVSFSLGNMGAKTVTVTPVDDALDDGPQFYFITATTSTSGLSIPDYDGVPTPNIGVLNLDDDITAGYTLSKSTSTITEGGNDTFTIVLDAQPATDVVIDLSSDDAGAASVSPTSLTFTNANWSDAQTVTLTLAAPASSLLKSITTSVAGWASSTIVNVS